MNYTIRSRLYLSLVVLVVLEAVERQTCARRSELNKINKSALQYFYLKSRLNISDLPDETFLKFYRF